MAAFAGVCIGGPMLLGNSVMNKTNPEHETDLERQLRAKGSYHAQVGLAALGLAAWNLLAAAQEELPLVEGAQGLWREHYCGVPLGRQCGAGPLLQF